MSNTFMDRVRSFFGFESNSPRNDFRNPIWGSDDDDDGDELYTKNPMDIYKDPVDLHREFSRQMQDMLKNLGSIFGDLGSFFGPGDMESFGTMTDLPIPDPETDKFDSNRIRDYYLKPGYHDYKYEQPKVDNDLDGKISSNEISGLLQKKDEDPIVPQTPFNGTLVPGRPFCQTIITTSVTKADGTVETRRIVKNGNEVIEETTTSTEPDSRGPFNPMISPIDTTNFMFSTLSSLLKNFY
ncbi:uncharacterized protein LOC116768866 [Danaus plexippus]|uniref:uncharacterized protein LOC116768866 n=1 Tax=Danaus plexippus TaxID=13037 RepID=UPI002AB24F6B|nr:uncharacterized protein LOC116768866 [Danaus plexippus]